MWAEVKTFMAGKHYCKNIDSVLRLRRSLPTAVTSFFHDLLAYVWTNTTPWGQCSELSNLVNASLTLSADFSLAWGMHVAMVRVRAISMILDTLQWYFQNKRLKKGYFVKKRHWRWTHAVRQISGSFFRNHQCNIQILETSAILLPVNHAIYL